jgi:hypothetical protein
MQHSVERLSLFSRRDEKVFKKSPVRQFSFNKIRPGREQVAATVAEIVEDDRPVSPGSEKPGHSTADIPGPSGNQNFHKK